MHMKSNTKILATLSDKNCDIDFITTMYEAGMSGVRLNTAHQEFEGALKVIRNVRTVSDSIPIVLDTKGPEIRTTRAEQPLNILEGQSVHFVGDVDRVSTEDTIAVNYKHFVADIPIGTQILIDDGEIAFVVTDKTNDYLLAVARNSAVISSHKSVNVPGIRINLPSLSEKDKSFIKFAVEHKVDFIAHSFVRDKHDINAIYDIMNTVTSDAESMPHIIAKIENQEGVDNINEILDLVEGIMVARGDLGIEVPLEQIPTIQKYLIKRTRAKRCFVITATQMLHSMIHNPRPTRAEVSDVANAIYDGTDCLMLSGETAYGKYPIEAVQTMSSIAYSVEQDTPKFNVITRDLLVEITNPVPDFLLKCLAKSTQELPVTAIVLDTMTGRNICEIGSYNITIPIFVHCRRSELMRSLALYYAVQPFSIKLTNQDEFIFDVVKYLESQKKLQKTDLIAFLAGRLGAVLGSTYLEIVPVNHVLKQIKA